ncbi:hypothetical protein ACJ41O_013432 [Fusarium nematophilum]
MGMQGPLTAQALGRSPYDDVVERNEDDGEPQTGGTTQQYDHRGRPINPETKRINRDIIRSHNEVMLVIGVAEQENPTTSPEAEAEKRHMAYEEDLGLSLAFPALRCVEAVGAFGLDGLRQRILIYRRYSHIPFWDLYQASRRNFSFSRDVMPGAATSLFTTYTDRRVARLWCDRGDRIFARKLVHEVWAYTRVHLELFMALQRLGLTSNSNWLPSLSFFIPFTRDSPIPAPPLPQGFSVQSMLQWVGGVCVSVAPFLAWVMTQRLIRDYRPKIWGRIFLRLPSTGSGTLPTWTPVNDRSRNRTEHSHNRGAGEDVSPLRAVDGQIPNEGAVEAVRRPSTFSARGDDYVSDEEENEGLSATLISFDVEATGESTDAPAGLWSAELRPSVNPDARGGMTPPTLYSDTMLTQLPPLIASHIFTDAALRLLSAPYEAVALRLVGRALRLRMGLPSLDIYGANLLSGLSLTSVINFLGVQVLHLALSGEIWGVVTIWSQALHTTSEEWRESEEQRASGWPEE